MSNLQDRFRFTTVTTDLRVQIAADCLECGKRCAAREDESLEFFANILQAHECVAGCKTVKPQQVNTTA